MKGAIIKTLTRLKHRDKKNSMIYRQVKRSCCDCRIYVRFLSSVRYLSRLQFKGEINNECKSRYKLNMIDTLTYEASLLFLYEYLTFDDVLLWKCTRGFCNEHMLSLTMI